MSESTSGHQPRTTFPESLEERPSSRRHIRNSSGGSTSISNTLSIGELDTPTFSADKSPVSKTDNKPFTVDHFDFGMRLSPEFDAHHEETAQLMSDPFTPGPGTKAAPSGVLAAENTLHLSETPVKQASETKEDCLHRLSELSSRLLKDFSRTSSGRLADILSSSPFCNARVPDCSNGSQKCTSPKNTIGRVLESSQTFLEILQYFSPNPSSSSADSECSYSEYWDENEFVSITNDHSFAPHALALATGDGDVNHACTQNTNAQQTSSASSSSSSTPSVVVDMPTTLTILTCYTCLVQTYDAIFSHIHNLLSSQAEVSPQSTPAILPGLHIGGFDLDDHRDLQMEILIQLSSKMLERIEETLGISVISQPQDMQQNNNNSNNNNNDNHTPRGRGILDTASASALLDIMFKQKDLECSRGGAHGRAAWVKQTMDNIREILGGNNGS
ncbi:MAG: hypothetical protein M1837_006789 [Sclerophora amabilis]|nr:MAG: hypothetical protein M1837_006789 [Sclerophora amabilis]